MKSGTDEQGHEYFDLDDYELAQLATVGLYMMFFTDGSAPCSPSHQFCQAGALLPDDVLMDLFYTTRAKKSEAKKRVETARKYFAAASLCDQNLGSTMSRDDLGEWIGRALSETVFTDEVVLLLHSLALAIGKKVRLDA